MLKEKLFKVLLKSLPCYKQSKIVKKATNVCNIYSYMYTLKGLPLKLATKQTGFTTQE